MLPWGIIIILLLSFMLDPEACLHFWSVAFSCHGPWRCNWWSKKQQKYRHINNKQPKVKQKQPKYQQKTSKNLYNWVASVQPCPVHNIFFIAPSHLKKCSVTDLLFCKLKSLIPSIFAGSHVVHDAGAVCQNLNRRLEGGGKDIITILLYHYIND